MLRALSIVAGLAISSQVALSALASQPAGDAPVVRYDGHKIVRVHIDSQRDLLAMQHFSEDIWVCGQIRRGPVEFRVAPDALPVLEAAGIEFEVVVDNVQALIDAERAHTDAVAQLRGPDFFAAYRTYQEISDYVDTLVGLRPDLAQRFSVGQTLEERDIFAMRITSPIGQDKPIIFIHTLTHAREWITGSAGMYIADRLVRDYGVDPTVTSLLDTFEFVHIPVTNPDGYVFSWGPDRLWRKNRRPNADGTFGVDNNRNWGFQWGGPGSSDQPNNQTYRGPAPFSEVENQALRDFIIANPRIVATMDIHSFSQLILSPWGFTDMLPADANLFAAIDGAMKAGMESLDGRTYRAGPTYTTIYPAAGVGQDWSYGARQTLGWGFELRPATSQQGGFILPADQIVPASIECERGVFAAAEYLRDNALYFGFPEGIPDVVAAQSPVNILFEARRGRVAIDGSSTRFFWRIGRTGAFTQAPVTPLGNFVGRANLTSARCGSVIQFYVEARTAGGAVFTYPPLGAAAPVEIVAAQVSEVFYDGFETDLGWTPGLPGDTATSGIWERGTPIGTSAQPNGAYAGANCYFTGQHPGGGAGANDVDNGFTTLLSPRIDLSGRESPFISYWRWYSNNAGANPGVDIFTISVSNDDGATWQVLEIVGPGGPHNGGGWHFAELPLPAGMTPTANMRVRFVASDENPQALVEAAVDEFRITAAGCAGAACRADWDRNGVVNSADISYFLSVWLQDLQSGTTAADFNSSGQTDSNDISAFLADWLVSVTVCN